MNLPTTNKQNPNEKNTLAVFNRGIIYPTKDPNLERLRSKDGLITIEYKICFAKYKCRKFSEIPVAEANNLVYDLVIKSFNDLGRYKIDENQKVLDHLPKAIISLIQIRKDFHYLTPELLSIILEYGCRSEFKKTGELDSISIIYIERWIVSSWEHTDFIDSYKSFIDLSKQIENKQTLTASQEEYDIVTQCLIAFEDFKTGNTIPMFAKPLWDYIRKKKNIGWSKEKRKEIIKIVESRKNNFIPRSSNLQTMGEELKNYQPATHSSVSLEIYFRILIDKKRELNIGYELTPEFKQQRWPQK